MDADKNGYNYQLGLALAFNAPASSIDPVLIQHYTDAMRKYEKDPVEPVRRRFKQLHKRLVKKGCGVEKLAYATWASSEIVDQLEKIVGQRESLLNIATATGVKVKKRIQI
jgi:hypothetical protein